MANEDLIPGDQVLIGRGKVKWRVQSNTNGRLVLHSENGTVRWMSVTSEQVTVVSRAPRE